METSKKTESASTKPKTLSSETAAKKQLPFPASQLPPVIIDYLALQQLFQSQIVLSTCFPKISPFGPPPVKTVTIPAPEADNPVALSRALRAKEEHLWRKLLREQEERHRRATPQSLSTSQALSKPSRKGVQKKLYVPPGPYIIETPFQAHERRKRMELENATEFLNKYNELIPRQQVLLAAECGKLLRKRLGLEDMETSSPLSYVMGEEAGTDTAS